MKRIVLAVLLAAALFDASCKSHPADEAPPLVGPPPKVSHRGASPNVETVMEGTFPEAVEMGRHLALVTATRGQAIVAFTSRGILYTSTSDRDRRAWRNPVRVGDAGESERPISLALDQTTGTLGLAYVDATQQIRIATSKDSGKSWLVQRVTPGSPGRDPSIGVANGRAYLSWVDAAGAHLAQGPTDDVSAWRRVEVPAESEDATPVVAVDSRGEPGLAWAAGIPLEVWFWRPGTAAQVALHTGDVSESYDVALAFEGARPRVALRGSVTDQYGVWLAVATDPGRTWLPPRRMPQDGIAQPDGPVSLAVSASGRVAVTAATREAKGSDERCGMPKVARSDDLKHWDTCSPLRNDRLGSLSPVVAFDGDNLVVAVTNQDHDARMPGIYVWREVTGEAAARRPPVDPRREAPPR
jgi:hypothetical protein